MYKKSQVKRLHRLAAICRTSSIALVVISMIVFVAALGPILTLAGQLILGLGSMIFAWFMLLSLMRKQASTMRRTRQRARKYSLDFE